MKIVNRKKFIKAIIVLLSIILLILIYFTNVSFSKVELKTKTVSIIYGDTLWSIAATEQANNEYYENKNIREIIQDIKNINSLDNNYIYEGQKIEIPTL